MVRIADLYTRRGKLYGIGGNEFIVTDATVDGMHEALKRVLVEVSWSSSEVPKAPWPAEIDGEKTDEAFFLSLEKSGLVRTEDDCIQLLLGKRELKEVEDDVYVPSNSWHCAVVQKLPADTDLREVAAAMVEVLEHGTFPPPRKLPNPPPGEPRPK